MPIARPADVEAEAIYAVRRWGSFERRNAKFRGSERDQRVNDLARGFACRWGDGIASVGTDINQYRWLASQICDGLCFVLPEGATGGIPTYTADFGFDAAVRQMGGQLHEVARREGLRVNDCSMERRVRSFTAVELVGRGPMWVLLHNVAPVCAFTEEPPGGWPIESLGKIVDPGMDLSPITLRGCRVLGARQSEAVLTPAHLVDLDDGARAEIKHWRPACVAEAMFNSFP